MNRRLFLLFMSVCATLWLTAGAASADVQPGDSLLGLVEPFTAFEGTTLHGTVAEFRDALTTTPASGFTATIAWGDGTSTAGTITGSGGSFLVGGAHAYGEEGSFPVTVTMSGIAPDLATAQASRTETVIDGAIAAAPVRIVAFARHRFTGLVATFTDGDPAGTRSDYAAAINWGDGSVSGGLVVPAGRSFRVFGSHVFVRGGAYAVTTIVRDRGGSSSSVVSHATAATANLRLSLAVSRRGGSLTYRLAVSNRGPAAATSLVLGDRLPAGTGLTRIIRGRFHCRAPRRGRSGTVTCSLPRLAAGRSASMAIVVTLHAHHGKRLVDSAHVSSTLFDPRTANNSARVSTRVG